MGNSIFTETFWRNPRIGNVSRVLQIGVLALLPATFVAGLYVPGDNCVQRIKLTYGLCLFYLFAHTAYFWLVDRPAVLAAFRELVALGRVEIKFVRGRYELWIDGRLNSAVRPVVQILAVAIYLIVVVFGCFWEPSLNAMCERRLIGGPTPAISMTLMSFLVIVFHGGLHWHFAVPFFRTTSPP